MVMALKKWEKENLAEGNRYTFALIFCEQYPDVAKEDGLKPVNYRAWVDFNDGLFTVWRNNGDKDFFDINFNYCGTKEY
jgi:hypothetical protein